MFQCLETTTDTGKNNFKIFIVEDSRVINNTVAKHLQEEGYECFQSYNLADAKEILNKHDMTLIILDLHLPDGDGEELIFELQKSEKETKIVIFTSDNDLSRRDELFRLGILDYVIKGKNAKIILKDILNIIYNIKINPNYTILIVDDSVVIRRMIKKILSPSGYRLLEAKNGEETFEIIQSQKIDLILLDMEMPEMNGLEILKNIKQDENNFHLPIFIISSNLDIEIMRNAYKQGALDYFKKPFSPEELKLKIEQVMQQNQNKRDLQCTIEASNSCKQFLNKFYANAIFYANSRKKWSDSKFIEIFGESSNNLIQTFDKVDKGIITDMIIAMKEYKAYKNSILYNDKKYLLKLFPLKENEFLISLENLKN